MIFVCTGSRNYQFDRLIKELDDLVKREEIREKVVAQIGESNYRPNNFSYVKYVNTEEFEKLQNEARIVITHGGVGTIVGALKKGKYVIGVPRLQEYGEHIDDHQVQIIRVFEEKSYIKAVYDIKELLNAIKYFDGNISLSEYSGNSKMINIIENYLKGKDD